MQAIRHFSIHLVTALLLLVVGAGLAGQKAVGSPPRTASDFTITGADGRPLKFSDFQGEVVLLNFWASWCGPCRQEMPILDRIHQRYKSLGFTVVGVNVDEDRGPAMRMLSESRVSFPVGFDPRGIVSTVYSVDSMPSTVIVDRKGIVRHVHRGYQPGFEDQYIEQIKTLARE
jgi:thiol-disulfide isomerase/thioredoxin